MILKKNDIILMVVILVIALLAGIYVLATKKEGGLAVLTYDGGKTLDIDLSRDTLIEFPSGDYTIHIEVKDGKVAFVNSECPDHICEAYGFIGEVGDTAVCLPAKASITVTKTDGE